ncbi:uncharacterized protein LOC142321053 [Lycorma delicatula]|uniref:uncharacterized protein LOC142321053 n=1 Tax=Lycorma delicatula TaxID=130591 RepID=UPI003F511603
MQPSGHLPENQSRKYAAQLFSAVNHLHKHFVVHRDLKLENILIDKRKDWIKLIDFGLSNTWSNKTFLSTNCGSPEYAAPELFVEGRGYGAEVDLWSLGVVLYIMASGKLPFRVKISQHESFQNNHRIALYHQITRGLTTRHFNNIKHYSEGFLQLLEKLLVPNADKRISICAALRHPWITAIKKNIVQSSWKTGLYAHQKILEEVSKIANISVVELSALLKYEPYGKLGGLYNIIAHNKMLNERNSTSPYKSNSCKCHFDNRANDDSSVYRI